MIAGVILAAGRSTRMGRSKALLLAPCGRTFIARLVDTLEAGGVATPFVVGRSDDEALKAAVESFDSRARWVENPEADSGGQLSSVIAGLRKADRPGVRGIMVIPVDAPMIASETVKTLIAVFTASGAPVVRPEYAGRHGHPVVFSRAVFDELRHTDPARGAKAVVHAHHDTVINVPVDDPGVVGDIDTPQDYDNLVQREGRTTS
jgi:molybdenum cofactor cytidylyltransferase